MSSAADLEDLVTGAEAARRLGISTQRVHQLAGQDGFPRPLGRVGNSIVWRWDDLELWQYRRGLNTPGGIASFPLEELELPARTFNTLRRVGVETIGDLLMRRRADLEQVPNFSARAIDALEATLKEHGLTLRP